MMEAARRELDRMRASSAAWEDLRYERVTGADGYACDGHAARRASVLWALQYDRRAADLPLVRWLAEQEALCRREAPFQGLTEETELAGLLLAEYRQVEDVWLHWEIKRANFDTWCGYDVEHLFGAGTQTTVGLVRASTHVDRDDVLEHLLNEEGQPYVSEDDLAQWARHERSRFPADPAAEDPLRWVQRAQLMGDDELARRWLDRWADGRPRDKSTLGQLRYQLAELGAFTEAAKAQRESLAFADSAWDSASAWQSLAQLERQAGARLGGAA
ncbi:hypothetical protein ACIA59_11945 [Micromonospora haikouensis]|uniref:hypothetical protein n=1 Tax=Micromonospora haikouensis TaxID=686309 RepID=UPI003794B193